MEPQRGIITHNVVSMRAEPRGGSEQVSQAILGDVVIRLEERDEYVRVQTTDSYEGWIWRRHLCAGDPAEVAWPFDTSPQRARFVAGNITDLCAKPGEPQTIITKLVFGTWARRVTQVQTDLGFYWRVLVPYSADDGNGRKLTAGYVDARDLKQACSKGYADGFEVRTACSLAMRFIGVPYLWGGTTPFGFDCSGFVQRIYSMLGVTIPRDAYLQARSPLGQTVPEGKRLRAGDLIFFRGQTDPRNRGITHVGMALDARRFIHAVSKAGVIVTPFNDPYYASQYTYCGAWRYTPAKIQTTGRDKSILAGR